MPSLEPPTSGSNPTSSAPHGAGDPLTAVAALPGVPEAVADARAAVDRLLGHRVLRRRSAEVSGESALRGAWASAALEGAAADLALVRSGQIDTDEMRAALRVSAELGNLQGIWERTPLQAVARLHLVAAADVCPAEELGRPRTTSSGQQLPAHEVTARLDGLGALLAARTTAPAVVVAAIVHAELLAIAPFTWGNGIVARAASRLVLLTRGLDPKGLAVPEVGHLELGGRTTYAEMLDAYRSGSAQGVAAWVVHCAGAVALGAREGLAICEALERG